jgi:hypothetical protein
MLASAGYKDSQNNQTGDVFYETYIGVVSDRYIEGCEPDTADCVKVNTVDGDTVYFTVIDTTEIIGSEDIEVGNTIEIECESYTTSYYHPILTATIIKDTTFEIE